MRYTDYDKLMKAYLNEEISYREFVDDYCRIMVADSGLDPDKYYDFYDLAEHDLYIYLTNEDVIVIRDFY